MALKKDKQKVLGETFDDERVRSFLSPVTRPGFDNDYILLERAYRSMKADNFSTFVSFYVDAGHNINAQNPEGKTLLALVKQHRSSDDYAQALIQHGAN